MNGRESDIKALAEKMKLKEDQFRAEMQSHRITSDAGKKPALKAQAELYKQEWKELEEQLKRLKAGESPLNDPRELRRRLMEEWSEKVHLLDFKDPVQVFRSLLDNFEREDAALLLVQYGRRRMAELYARRIYDVIQSESSTGIQRKPLPIEDSALLTPDEFISRLGKWFGEQTTTSDHGQRVDQTIKDLYKSVRGGQTIFVDITCAELSGSFLDWFLQNFWKPLIDRLEEVAEEKRGVRIVVLLMSRTALKADMPPPEISTEVSKFDRRKVFGIDLHDQWQEEHIESWVTRHVQESLRYYGYIQPGPNGLQRLDALVKQTYEDSDNGVPRLVCDVLRGSTIDTIVKTICP